MLPSGEYFLGRPLFFLARPAGEEGAPSKEAEKVSDGGGGGGACGGAGEGEPKGNRAVAGARMLELGLIMGEELLVGGGGG